MDCSSNFSSLPPVVRVVTNVAELAPPSMNVGLTKAELAECFLNARRSNIHTQPLPSDEKTIRKSLERLDSFHSSQLNPFLYGYMHPNELIPEHVLTGIREICVNADADWALRCQHLAFGLLTSELQAKSSGVIPRLNHDDPIALAQLRRVLPTLSYVPNVSVSNACNKFVGSFLDGTASTTQGFHCSIKVKNNGSQPFTMEVSQTQTVMDGVIGGDSIMGTSLDKATLQRGESVELKLSMDHLPRSAVREYEQLIVLSFDGVLRYFVSFAVVSPTQRLFGQRFPGCLPVSVRNSPLGEYSAPVVLQLLKHSFIRQEGYTSPAVVHLLLGKAINYRPHNEVVMGEAERLKRALEDQLDIGAMMASYWASLPDAKKAPPSRCCTLPVSSAQPNQYTAGSDKLGSAKNSSGESFFPNSATKIPDALQRAPPAVIMGLILVWLAEMDVAVFDASFINCDAVGYMQSMPPYLRGVLMWVLDLCCALLLNRAVNGATERVLALTFASILMRRNLSGDANQEPDTFFDPGSAFGAPNPAVAAPPILFATEVALHQNAVTAMLNWIAIYNSKYSKRSKT